MKNHFSLLLAAALLTVTLSVAGQSYDLKYRYRKGQTYHYGLNSVTNTTMEMGGQERNISSNSDQLFAVKVENVKKGKTTMLSTYEKMKVTVNIQGKDTVMDVPDAIGLRTRLTLLPGGRAIDVIRIDTMKSDIMQGMMQQSSMPLHFLKMPGKKVKPGDSWNYTGTDSTYDAAKKLVETTISIKLTLEKEEVKNGHACLRIGYTTKITTKGTSIMQGMEMYRDGSGDSKGTLWFDAKAGIMIADDSETNMDITVAITGEMAMTIPITVVDKQHYSLRE